MEIPNSQDQSQSNQKSLSLIKANLTFLRSRASPKEEATCPPHQKKLFNKSYSVLKFISLIYV